MGNYLFVSYAHKDKKIVNNIIGALESKGVSLWFDNGITAGADWSENIGSKLEGASLVLLMLSKASVRSKNVRREIVFAQENNIPILTVQIGSPRLDDDLKKRLTVNQFVNLKAYSSYGYFSDELVKIIDKYGVINSPDKKEYKDKKIKIKTGIVWKIIVLAVVLAIALTCLINKLFFSEAPTVIGMQTPPAEERLAQAEFEYAVGADYCDDEDIGYIFKQNIRGKTLRSSQIVITESLGPEEDLTDVPSLIGYHISEAVSKLIDANMKTFIIAPVTTSEYQIGYVCGQSIAAGYRVSAHSKIELSVSSKPGEELELFGKRITLDDSKLQIDIEDDGEIIITPVMVMGVDVDYSETDPINSSGSINADISIALHLKREDTEPYGRFRGSFEMCTKLEGDESIAWKAVEAVLAENGEVSLLGRSDDFSVKLEPWDEEKYDEFAKKSTNADNAVPPFSKPIAMALISEVVMTEMNSSMKAVSKLAHYANMFSVGIPDVKGDTLYQSLSIVIQENGEVWVTLLGSKGVQRAFEFHGKITYDQKAATSAGN